MRKCHILLPNLSCLPQILKQNSTFNPGYECSIQESTKQMFMQKFWRKK